MPNDGGPAFPTDPLHGVDGTSYLRPPSSGMSLRDYYAGVALPVLLALEVPTTYPPSDWLPATHRLSPGVAARRAFEIADAMIAARDVDHD